MNCTTCHYELSQCLDGRLPSGRRAVVMQHVTACDACAEFWRELQEAQRLALQLPRERVGESFRDELWERIRAGEGTPEDVFHEPVPLLVKARYALTGAAAAAAILLAGLWLHDARKAPVPSTEDVARAESVISGPAVVESNDAPGRREEPFSILSAAQPLTADLVAEETARQIEDRFASLDFALRQLSRPQDESLRRALQQRLLAEASDIREFAEVLFDLRERNRLSFGDPEVAEELRLTAHMLEQVRRHAGSFETTQAWVAQAVEGSRRLGNITSHIFVAPPTDPREEAAVLVHISSAQPEVFAKLFVVIGPGEQIHDHFDLMPQRVFRFEDFCGSSYVAPKSVIQRRQGVVHRRR